MLEKAPLYPDCVACFFTVGSCLPEQRAYKRCGEHLDPASRPLSP